MFLLNIAFQSVLPCTVTTRSCSKCPFPPLIRPVSVHLCLSVQFQGEQGVKEKFWNSTHFPSSWSYAVVWGGWSHPVPLLHKYCGCFAETHFEHSLMLYKNVFFRSGFVSSKYLSFTLPLSLSFSYAHLPRRILLLNH